jgi:hypothetical protein
MNETPNEPLGPDEDRRRQQNDPAANLPGGQSPPPRDEDDEDEDLGEEQAPSRRRISSGRRLAAAGFAVVVLLGGGAALALSGGGGDGDDTTSSSDDDNGSSPEDAAFEFAQCMRDNGIEEFADPQVDEEGGISMGGSAVVDQLDTDEYKAAEDACQHILDDAAPAPPEGEEPLTPEERAALQDEWHAISQCVRDQGYDFPTPEVDEYGRLSGVRAVDEVEQALEDCVNQSSLNELPGGEGESSGEEEGS